MSYPDEEIVIKKGNELQAEDFGDLTTILIENPKPEKRTGIHLADEELIRGSVPMTKEEVRTVSIAKLKLTKNAVIYDVGAGTGSVSIEAALQGENLRVYAIEKNPEGAELIRKNMQKFRAAPDSGYRRSCTGGTGSTGNADPCFYRRQYRTVKRNYSVHKEKKSGRPYRDQCNFAGNREGSDGGDGGRTACRSGNHTTECGKVKETWKISHDDRVKSDLYYFRRRRYRMKIPGIVIAASASGSGKTAVTMAMMKAFKNAGKKVRACKCGPDYIDPMFHREVLGIDSENLDLYFCDRERLKEWFMHHAEGAELVVTEGVMGYYDGISLDSDQASTYDVARTLGLPVILVVPARGMASTILADIIEGND